MRDYIGRTGIPAMAIENACNRGGYAFSTPSNAFRHDHDLVTDLTVANGRINGAVWLERQYG